MLRSGSALWRRTRRVVHRLHAVVDLELEAHALVHLVLQAPASVVDATGEGAEQKHEQSDPPERAAACATPSSPRGVTTGRFLAAAVGSRTLGGRWGGGPDGGEASRVDVEARRPTREPSTNCSASSIWRSSGFFLTCARTGGSRPADRARTLVFGPECARGTCCSWSSWPTRSGSAGGVPLDSPALLGIPRGT